ncbi:hypothetical protein F5B17DRAFT_303552 [Nemania serpens]|nr:hypothetical protein F5B17DRAFT_303552 [Nemania serpens]
MYLCNLFLAHLTPTVTQLFHLFFLHSHAHLARSSVSNLLHLEFEPSAVAYTFFWSVCLFVHLSLCLSVYLSAHSSICCLFRPR